MRAVRRWLLVLGVSFLAGCWIRYYPPVAYVDRMAPIYPEPRPRDCPLVMLTAPPSRPHRVFAQVRSYGASHEAVEKMQVLIREKACEEGADAVVLLPVEEGEHINTETMYPDWVTYKADMGYGGRFPRWVDKRYRVAQRGIAVVFQREAVAQQKKPGL